MLVLKSAQYRSYTSTTAENPKFRLKFNLLFEYSLYINKFSKINVRFGSSDLEIRGVESLLFLNRPSPREGIF